MGSSKESLSNAVSKGSFTDYYAKRTTALAKEANLGDRDPVLFDAFRRPDHLRWRLNGFASLPRDRFAFSCAIDMKRTTAESIRRSN